jgi:hypothetical protein
LPLSPLAKSSSGRYFQDQEGHPFLIVGDAPQGSPFNLSLSNWDYLLANRQKWGFNALWLVLWDNTTDGSAIVSNSTWDGVPAFGNINDFGTLNHDYWTRVEAFVQMAVNRGFYLLLSPCDLSSVGNIGAATSNGAAKCTTFGTYLGARFAQYPGICWFHGIDFSTNGTTLNKQCAQALASGIAATAPLHLHLIEYAAPSTSLDDASWVPPVSLNHLYNHHPLYDPAKSAWNAGNSMPFGCMESDYEGENNNPTASGIASGTPVTNIVLRKQLYWAFLGGGLAGHIFGNKFIWQLNDGAVGGSWKANLDTTGVQHFMYWAALMRSFSWYLLQPDLTGVVATSGFGTYNAGATLAANDYVTTARTSDGHAIVSYFPANHSLVLDMTKCASSSITARWYDPTNGTYSSAGTGLTNTGTHTFTPSATNAAGDVDWCLLITS